MFIFDIVVCKPEIYLVYRRGRLQQNWQDKKLRYCEEHSASIMLSWCTLWHFSGENLL